MASRADTLKRVGILLLQLLVTAAGLWYVFHDPQKRAQIEQAAEGVKDPQLKPLFNGTIDSFIRLRPVS